MSKFKEGDRIVSKPETGTKLLATVLYVKASQYIIDFNGAIAPGSHEHFDECYILEQVLNSPLYEALK